MTHDHAIVISMNATFAGRQIALRSIAALPQDVPAAA